MITLRQIERLWTAQKYPQLFRELMTMRPEDARPDLSLSNIGAAAAALAIIRLDELAQAHVGLSSRLVRALLGSQEADGGWGDLMTTALCLRALMTSNGQGPAVERGLEYLANLQKPEGTWPRIPIRRTPADSYVSAFVLFQLGDKPAFRSAVRFDDAIAWFLGHQPALDHDATRLWARTQFKCGAKRPHLHHREPVASWS